MSEIQLLMELIRQHTEDDTRRFEDLKADLTEIGADVKSLVQTRDRGRGAWGATTAIAGGASLMMSALWALATWWLK